MRLSVTARIALLTIALALVSNFAVILFVWKQTHDDAIAGIRRDAIEQADALQGVYRTSGVVALRAAIDDAHGSGDTTLIAELLSPDGRRLTGTGPSALTRRPLEPVAFHIGTLGNEQPWGQHDAGYTIRRVGPYWLLYGRLLAVVEQEQRAVERALAVAVLVSLALGIIGGLVVSRYVATRLVRIAGVVEAVEAGDLSPRVPILMGGRGDAFDRLSARLNAMLDKVERLMAELRVVTDSLAHDLRSPLTRLRTKTENAVLIADPQGREAALSGLLTETDIVMRMLTMVIEISRAEQVTRDRFIAVAPAELVEEIGELYEPVAEDAGIDFSVALDAEPAPRPIHRELLTQAVTNLIDNAIRHGAGGAITLRLAETARAVCIQVEDRGPGIAEADRAQALKRFGRLDLARSKPGAGLGMALVEAVARLHDGRFELDDNAPGLIARIVLPRA
ncbi:Signal protein [Sphingomonas sp. EC-HK361]|jgi:signal transduction histidine kinase|uniref:sensor histidine kinase n=1 Tax=Sphingomonas sp. EC-HK361 TaxID=2038397 RepID=UPI001258FC26|nr:HAMP domain-containing sensor histidine kinase [Sphingomonas sp. EC-HK361]VVT15443.1 Signal protein [Sphingomonas sp. EC-HK361]